MPSGPCDITAQSEVRSQPSAALPAIALLLRPSPALPPDFRCGVGLKPLEGSSQSRTFLFLLRTTSARTKLRQRQRQWWCQGRSSWRGGPRGGDSVPCPGGRAGVSCATAGRRGPNEAPRAAPTLVPRSREAEGPRRGSASACLPVSSRGRPSACPCPNLLFLLFLFPLSVADTAVRRLPEGHTASQLVCA